jgi:hypothetical protein
MENVTFIEIETIGGTQTHAVIDNGDGTITTMLKETYDAQQAEHLNGIVDGETL